MPRAVNRSVHVSLFLALAGACLLGWCAEARAVMELKRSMEAPPIALRDASGAEVTSAQFRGSILVIIFGEVYHEKTRQACNLIHEALRDPRLKGQPLASILVAAEAPAAGGLKVPVGDKLPAIVLRDPERKAFGAYQIAAMPSVVVIDKEGRVVHAIGGLIPRLADLVTDSALYAAGKLSAEQFEASLSARPTTLPSEQHVRADRTAQLGRQLARRGLDEMAVEKYREALSLEPGHVMAREELAMVLLKHRRLAEAEEQFRAVLADHPGSTTALLGVAFVQTLRGGDELVEAERTVRAVLARSPAQPQGHYLLGLIQEQRGKPEEAAAGFKKAAQLLMEMGEE